MKKPRKRRAPIALAALVLVLLSLVAAACGDDDEEGGAATGPGDRTTQAFLEAMTPHHDAAIEMARMAEERAEHPEINELAGDIVSAQEREVALMEAIHERLFDSELQPNEASYRDLGLTAEEAAAGDHMDPGELADADPFDRAFIDMMVPHHQAAVRMARAVLADTDDAEVKRLANDIITAQSREIRQMNEWREQWYGEASPAGDVPSDEPHGGEEGGDMETEMEGH